MLKHRQTGGGSFHCTAYFYFMNYLDIIFIIPLLWGLYKGITKGLIIEAATLIAFGLAVWGAIKFHDFLSEWMRAQMGWESKWLPIAAFALIFIGVLLVVMGVAKLLEKIVKSASLGFLNKLGGAVFGILKFGLIMSMILFFLEAVNRSIGFIPDELKSGSLLYEPVRKIAPTIIPGLTESNLNNLASSGDSTAIKINIGI